MKTGVLVFIAMILLSACSVEPTPVNYGSDECAFCSMMIMDARFGSELVTDKGKIFKFDSGECMIRYSLKKEDQVFSHIMVTHFNEPNKLHDARTSYFVVSDKIPSPMGGNLSAYRNAELASTTVKKNGGEVFSWEEILDDYQKN